MAISIEDLTTLANTTLPTYYRDKYTDTSLPFTKYPGWFWFFKTGFDTKQSGPHIEFPFRYRNTGNFSAKRVRAFDEAHETTAQNNIVRGKVSWYEILTSYTIDNKEEAFQGGDAERIVSTLEERVHTCMNDEVEGFEPLVWSSPASDTADQPLGIPSYIVKDTTSNGGFLGKNPAGFTNGVANLNSNTYTGWRNYAGKYVNITPEDLIHNLRLALEETDFEAPHPVPNLENKDKRVIFCTTAGKVAMSELLTKQNDNLGDLTMPYAGVVQLLKGVPFVKVPYLDVNDASQPFYGVNFSTLRPVKKTGYDRKFIPLQQVDSRRFDQRVAYYQTFYGLECVDRRNQWVFSRAA